MTAFAARLAALCLVMLALAARAEDADYSAAAEAINATMRAHHYNPKELKGAAYREIEEATLALGQTAATDEAFIKGY
ncbi:MAG: hypothetical protein R3C58_16440, partial [Parvularculaceae bacterium]